MARSIEESLSCSISPSTRFDTDLPETFSQGFEPWRKRHAVHFFLHFEFINAEPLSRRNIITFSTVEVLKALYTSMFLSPQE